MAMRSIGIGGGSQGPQGPQGPQGVSGGPQGFQGAQGVQGAPGVQGTQGFQGYTGPQGTQGEQGFQGFQGAQGSQGSQGTQGFQGNQGFQGTTGAQGVQGSQGFQGFQGNQGFQGSQGSQGVQGTTGVAGPPGTDGSEGIDGSDGPQGYQGYQGFQGAQGNQGAAGSTGAQGTGTTSTGAFGSEPGSPNAGDLYFPDNSYLIERYSGSAWLPWGTCNFPLTPPVNGDFAWINQGSASVDTTYGGIYLLTPADADANNHLRIRKKAKTAPYTITAEMEHHCYAVSTAAFGLTFRQSSDGKLHALLFQMSGNVVNMYSAKFTDESTFSALYLGSPVVMYGFPRFVRIADNNTNRVLSWSNDGQHWHIFHTIGRTDFLTADEVGFFIQSSNITYPAAVLLTHWKETA